MRNKAGTMETDRALEEDLFRMLRAALGTGEGPESPGWRPLFEEMKAQTVAALPGAWLETHPIPGAEAWRDFCLAQQAQWLRVMQGQAELLARMEEWGIPCVILKGAAAAAAYPHPMLRMMGDVDFLVRREDFTRTAARLEEAGYRLTHRKNDAHHHYCYARGGIHFELHRRPGGLKEGEEALIGLFEQGVENRTWAECEGFRFPALPAELNGLSLLLHIRQHLREGLGLRQIVDWSAYLGQLGEEKRQEKLLPLVRQAGLEKLETAVTELCRQRLGLRAPAAPEACPWEELLDLILEKGNFGRKAGERGKTAAFLLSAEDGAGFFDRLQRGGLCRWKAAERHRILRPFAWIYQGFRILGIFVREGIGPRELAAQRRKGLAQRRLMERLGVEKR